MRDEGLHQESNLLILVTPVSPPAVKIKSKNQQS